MQVTDWLSANEKYEKSEFSETSNDKRFYEKNND